MFRPKSAPESAEEAQSFPEDTSNLIPHIILVAY